MILKDISKNNLKKKVEKRCTKGWLPISGIFKSPTEVNGEAKMIYSVELMKVDERFIKQRKNNARN